MKSFAVDDHGDVIIEENDVKMAYDADLIIQKIRQVLSTNRGEWWLNPKEGIPVKRLLQKNPNDAIIRDYVRSAIAQVDTTLQMTSCEIQTAGRQLQIAFSVAGKRGSARAELEV